MKLPPVSIILCLGYYIEWYTEFSKFQVHLLTEGLDYSAHNETLNITDSTNLYFYFNIGVLQVGIVEGNETFSAHLSSSDSRVKLGTNKTVVIITDQNQREPYTCLTDFIIQKLVHGAFRVVRVVH